MTSVEAEDVLLKDEKCQRMSRTDHKIRFPTAHLFIVMSATGMLDQNAMIKKLQNEQIQCVRTESD